MASQNSKKKKSLTTLLPYKMEYDVLKESMKDFEDRIQGMPTFLLLNEHRNLCEQFGIQMAKTGKEWSDTLCKIHDRVSLVRKEILHQMHTMYDQMLASEYYADQEYHRAEKEKKNVKVSKKSNK